jgi:hypothetical protein
MMSFLTYITGFFMNFAYFDRLCKLEKHGGHLGYKTAQTDTIFKGDNPRFISAKFD